RFRSRFAESERSCTYLAGKGSAVRIRHAPPSNPELRFSIRTARVPELASIMTTCRMQGVAGALKKALNCNRRGTAKAGMATQARLGGGRCRSAARLCLLGDDLGLDCPQPREQPIHATRDSCSRERQNCVAAYSIA